MTETVKTTSHSERNLKILFACTQNAVRSVIAEALLNQKNIPDIDKVRSCGVIVGVADGFTIAVMAELGIDVSSHEPTNFDALNPADFDIIISFSHDAEHFVQDWAIEGTNCMFWDVKPPLHSEHSRDETLLHYQHLRDDIAARIDGFIASIS